MKRVYYWYRPLPLSYTSSDRELSEQAAQYRAWLAQHAASSLDPTSAQVEAELQDRRAALFEARVRLCRQYAITASTRGPRGGKGKPHLEEQLGWAEREEHAAAQAIENMAEIRQAIRERNLNERIGCHPENKGLLREEHDREQTIREEIHLSDRCRIRVVRVHSLTARNFYGRRVCSLLEADKKLVDTGEARWFKLRKPDAVTTYSVLMDGRQIDSFLSMARAKAFAKNRGIA